MKVQEVKLEDDKRRYLLVDDNGLPVIPVARYLKYIDNTGKSFNTQKTYCYSLKLYFEYLKQIKEVYKFLLKLLFIILIFLLNKTKVVLIKYEN